MSHKKRSERLSKWVRPYWPKLEKICAKSLGRSSKNFLGDIKRPLGFGYWGTVWPTADPKFVLKATIDNTEGPHVALVISKPKLRLHPGMAYFRMVRQSAEDFYDDDQGYSSIYFILREAVSMDFRDRRGKPKRGYKRVYDALEAIPECCACLYEAIDAELSGSSGTPGELARCRKEAEKEFYSLTKKLNKTPGQYVGDLLRYAYQRQRIMLGDVHFENVGQRCHNLKRKYRVPAHKKLVVTDLGDPGKDNPAIDYDAIDIQPFSMNPFRGLPQWYREQLAQRIPIIEPDERLL